jgi:hypothetical protein
MPLLYWVAKFIDAPTFCIGLAVYVILYRPFVDSLRLIDLGLLKKQSLWKMFLGLIIILSTLESFILV